jgi:hypothetical protein
MKANFQAVAVATSERACRPSGWQAATCRQQWTVREPRAKVAKTVKRPLACPVDEVFNFVGLAGWMLKALPKTATK